MKPLGDTNSHFWLVQRMAQATETDLVAAMARGGPQQCGLGRDGAELPRL